MTTSAHRLEAAAAQIGYGTRTILPRLDLRIPDGSFTAIVGPNGCGKSTALRAFARLLPARAGRVTLDGRDVQQFAPRELARVLGLLPQSSVVPEGMTVGELVGRGRYPHQRSWRQWSAEDAVAVDRALDAAGVTDLVRRRVDELSGGQRQRVWIAMVLAQETDVLLLDEPTTFLDVAHQLELLELLRRLHLEGRTVVAVLHDLQHAARYASHVVAMRDGAVVASGTPDAVFTRETVREVFGVDSMIITDPVTSTPLVLPIAKTA